MLVYQRVNLLYKLILWERTLPSTPWQFFFFVSFFLEWCENRDLFTTGWWFQIFFIFTPIWGRFPIWRAYFSDGLKPPTRQGCWWPEKPGEKKGSRPWITRLLAGSLAPSTNVRLGSRAVGLLGLRVTWQTSIVVLYTKTEFVKICLFFLLSKGMALILMYECFS